MSHFTIVKARFSKDVRIGRNRFYGALQDTYPEQAEDLFPAVRSRGDALRWGLTQALRAWQRFEHSGDQCRAIAATAKTDGRGLAIDIHVQRIGQDVDYSRKVCRLTVSRSGEASLDKGPDFWSYRTLTDALDPAELIDYGQSNLFDSDLRRILDTLLDGQVLRLWPGIFVALGRAQVSAVEQAQALFHAPDAGTIRFSLLSLENSQANREALADELAQEFERAYSEIETRAEGPGPNTERLTDELMALDARRSQAERILDVTIPCDDAQTSAELSVMALA